MTLWNTLAYFNTVSCNWILAPLSVTSTWLEIWMNSLLSILLNLLQFSLQQSHENMSSALIKKAVTLAVTLASLCLCPLLIFKNNSTVICWTLHICTAESSYNFCESQCCPMFVRFGNPYCCGRIEPLWGKTKTRRPMLWPLVALRGNHADKRAGHIKMAERHQGN